MSSTNSRAGSSASMRRLHRDRELGRFVALESDGGPGLNRAYDRTLRREVVLKTIPRGALEHGADAQIVCAAQFLARLSHPNLISVFDVIIAEDSVILAVESPPGQTVREWLASGGRRSWSSIVAMFIQAGRGLVAAHREGLCHGHLDLDHIRITEDGRAVITGFGLDAQPLSTTALDPSEDQWAFCAALWQALGGVPGSLVDGDECLAPRPSSRPPRRIVAVLRRGLAVEAKQRWPSVHDLLEALGSRSTNHGLRWSATAAIPILVFAATRQADRAELCSGAQQHLSGIWDPQRRMVSEQAMLATGVGFAPETWVKVASALDRYAEDWSRHYESACEATVRHETQTEAAMDLRLQCLERHAVALRSVVDVLAAADARVVEQSVSLVANLPALERCADIDALQADVPPPETKREADIVNQARVLLAEASTEHKAGHPRTALTKLERAEALVADLAYPPIRAEIASVMAAIQESAGDFDAAQRGYERALDLNFEAGTPSSTANVMARLAALLGQSSGYIEQGLWLARAAATLARAEHSPPRVVAQTHNSLGAVLYAQGRYEAAKAEFRKERAALERILGPEHPAIATSRNNLGVVLDAQGLPAQAEREYRAALGLRLSNYGAGHPAVGKSHNNLGVVLYAQGRDDEAEAEFRRALAVLEPAYGRDNLLLANLRNNLANVLVRRGRFAQAVREHRQVLAIRLEALGPDHPQVAQSRNNLGNALEALGRLDEAEKALRAAVASYTRAFGPDHPQTADSRVNLAKLLGRRGDVDEAEQELRRVVELYSRLYGSEHPRTGHVLMQLGLTLRDANRTEEAREVLERAWMIGSRGSDLPLARAQIAFALAELLWHDHAHRRRALELAKTARSEYTRAGDMGRAARAKLERWLAARHAS